MLARQIMSRQQKNLNILAQEANLPQNFSSYRSVIKKSTESNCDYFLEESEVIFAGVPTEVTPGAAITKTAVTPSLIDFNSLGVEYENTFLLQMIGSELFESRLQSVQSGSLSDRQNFFWQLIMDIGKNLKAPEFSAILEELGRIPTLIQFCEFYAVTLKKNKTWPNWPSRLLEPNTTIETFEYREEDFRAIVLSQWIAKNQMNEIQSLLREHDSRLLQVKPKELPDYSFESFLLHKGNSNELINPFFE